MTRKDRLYENYEDALFALIMEEIAEEEAKQLHEENERLKRDPTAAVPQSVSTRCIKTIKAKLAKKNRQSSGKVIYRAFSKVAVVAIICAMLFVVAYAASPELRVKTLNLLIEASDVSTRLIISTKGDEQTNDPNIPHNTSDESVTIFGYRFPAAPEGFDLKQNLSGDSRRGAWRHYENFNGDMIRYDVCVVSEDTPFNVDTEDVQRVTEIQVCGYNGLLIEKDNRIHIVWADTDRSVFCTIICTGLDETVVIQLAGQVCYVGK